MWRVQMGVWGCGCDVAFVKEVKEGFRYERA
jgi:hypothetical protein